MGQARRIAVGEDETEFRLGEDRMRRARHRQNLTLLALRRLVGQDAKRADIESGKLAGQFVAHDQAHRPVLNQADIAREERPSVIRHPVLRAAAEAAAAEFERGHVLEEEITRFRREQREPRRVHLADVQRRIGKIRIDRQRVG